MIAANLAQRTTGRMRRMLLEARDAWHAAVNDYAVLADPQVAHNKNFRTVNGATGLTTITLVSHPVRVRRRSAECGCRRRNSVRQSEEILRELGYARRAFEALCAKGAVGVSA